MNHRRRHDIVRVHPVPIYDELTEIVRQEEISQTRVARQILQSPALCRMVDAVASGEADGIRVEITIRG